MRNPALLQRYRVAKDALRKTLGTNIRRERTLLGISQHELGARCGLHPRTIARIEAGEIGIRPETLARLQRAIGCTFQNGTIEKPMHEGTERRQ
ncbi:MAG: helix-turn-helix protein [Verrucomicrobiota bacterium]